MPLSSGSLMPAMLARRAANLAALRRNCSVFHRILRAAGGAGEDHAQSPLPGRSRQVNRNATGLARQRGLCDSAIGEEIELPSIAEFDSVGLRYGTGAEVLRDLDFRLAAEGSTSSPVRRAPARRRC